MDFYCQRCGKTVDIDESLLRIDLPVGDLARGGMLYKHYIITIVFIRYKHNIMFTQSSI